MLSFFPLDVLDEIWDLIESVSEGFLTYSCRSYSSRPLSKANWVPVETNVLVLKRDERLHRRLVTTIKFQSFQHDNCTCICIFLRIDHVYQIRKYHLKQHLVFDSILHDPSMLAVKTKIYGVLNKQSSSIAFDETSSYWSALKSSKFLGFSLVTTR